jgi:hypothetical protein
VTKQSNQNILNTQVESMKKFSIRVTALIVILLTVCSRTFSSVPVSLRPRLYLGMGIRSAFHNNVPAFEIADNLDQNYYNLNLSSVNKIFLHGQVRLNLIKVGPVSAGYTFWAHNQQYLHDWPEFWAKEDKFYPHSYNYNLHGAVLQYDLKFPWISGKYFTPFVIGGAGQFTGNAKQYYFEFEYFEEADIVYITDVITETKRYRGKAVFFGIGAVVLKYGYFQFGYIDFRDGTLPIREFATAVFGLTI